MKERASRNPKNLLLLHGGVLIYALSSVFSKYAAGEAPFSPMFFLFYGLSLLLLFCYAIVWQQALRHFALNTAYANRAVAMVWSMLFGLLLFGETIRWNQVLGAAVIIAGVLLVVTADE